MAMVAWQTEREPGPCSERVARLRERYFTFRPAICVERALAYTRSYRETEGLATGVRRAAALKRVCADTSVTILDDELIVGMPAFQPRGAVICPEISWRWLKAELDTIATREQDPYDITDEQKRVLRDDVFPYWRGRSMEEYYLANLPAETRHIAVDTGVIDIELKSQNGPGEFSPGYGNILLKKGFGGIVASARERIAKLDAADPDHYDQLRFLELFDFFDATIYSSEVGVRKPNAAIYEEALRQTAAPRARTLFIGDRVREDIRGPRSCGITAVMTHEFRQEQPGPELEVEVLADLSSLPAVVLA